MTRSLVALLVTTAVLLGCGTSTSSDDSPPDVVGYRPEQRETSSTTTNRRASDDAYLQLMRNGISGANSKSDRELLSAGRTLCRRLDAFDGPDQLAEAGAALGYNMQELAYAVTAAVNRFCPEHSRLARP